MGKNKLKKFSDLRELTFVHQYPFARLQAEGFPMRGRWHEEQFHNSNPIVLELGCGKGEYTVNLAARNPNKNYIGVDIKGARMWTGATLAARQGLENVAFLRTDIEHITSFFAPGEVAEIWITFPDPQMKKVRKRLTSTRFLQLYSQILAPGGIIHLKTDSPFLYTYTAALAELNKLNTLANCQDVHGGPMANDPTLQIRTHYEQQWIDRGLTIKYLAFALPEHPELLAEPDIEIEHDTYRSYSRGTVQCPDQCTPEVKDRIGLA